MYVAASIYTVPYIFEFSCFLFTENEAGKEDSSGMCRTIYSAVIYGVICDMTWIARAINGRSKFA